MRGINKVILIGTLGRDPELKNSNGFTVTNISLATSESYKDKQGVKQERTEWHKVVFFGKLAEIANQYLKKGSKIYLEGKIKTDKYQKDGQDVYTTKIVADSMQMLDSKDSKSQSVTNSNQPATDTELFNDDVPF